MENLIKGKKYMVKHIQAINQDTPGKSTLRIFKGTEIRYLGGVKILCYNFSTRINKNISVSFEEAGDVTFWTWRGLKGINPPNEISIPYYLIREAKEQKEYDKS